MKPTDRILVVASHPDDEILGAGGSLARFAREGVESHIVILGEGVTARQDQRNPGAVKESLEILHAEVQSAAKHVGAVSASVLSFPDNRFDTVALLDIIKAVEKVKAECRPTVVFTHHGNDLNIDHRRTMDAVLTACRPMSQERVTEIYAFETLSSTEWQAPYPSLSFCPSFFVGISREDLDAKINAMECYTSERRSAPHPRAPESIESLARARGSIIGVEFAEAFETIRRVIR